MRKNMPSAWYIGLDLLIGAGIIALMIADKVKDWLVAMITRVFL